MGKPLNTGRIEMEPYLPKNPKISDKLMYLIMKNDLSVMEVSKRSGITYGVIRNYLYKDVAPSLLNAAKLAITLRTNLEWLAGLSEDQIMPTYYMTAKGVK